ncbi:hypothetical protein OROMI_003117 [Orobanche minor]
MNSLLSMEHSPTQCMVCRVPTLIVWMGVSHGSSGRYGSCTFSVTKIRDDFQWI